MFQKRAPRGDVREALFITPFYLCLYVLFNFGHRKDLKVLIEDYSNQFVPPVQDQDLHTLTGRSVKSSEKYWTNWAGIITTKPEKIFYPTSKDDVIAIIK